MHFTVNGFTYVNALDLQNIVHDAAALFDEVKEASIASKVKVGLALDCSHHPSAQRATKNNED